MSALETVRHAVLGVSFFHQTAHPRRQDFTPNAPPRRFCKLWTPGASFCTQINLIPSMSTVLSRRTAHSVTLLPLLCWKMSMNNTDTRKHRLKNMVYLPVGVQLNWLHALMSVELTPSVGRHGLVRLPNDVILQDLVRVRCPVVPQVAEHVDQSDHGVHKPGTG